jgi:hypothetical protein
VALAYIVMGAIGIFALVVNTIVKHNLCLQFTRNPYTVDFGWFHGQLMLGRWRIIF